MNISVGKFFLGKQKPSWRDTTCGTHLPCLLKWYKNRVERWEKGHAFAFSWLGLCCTVCCPAEIGFGVLATPKGLSVLTGVGLREAVQVGSGYEKWVSVCIYIWIVCKLKFSIDFECQPAGVKEGGRVLRKILIWTGSSRVWVVTKNGILVGTLEGLSGIWQ